MGNRKGCLLLRIAGLLTALLVIRKMLSPPNDKHVSQLLKRCRNLMRQTHVKRFAAEIIARGKQLAIKNGKFIQNGTYKEIDIVISSGGYSGQYALGIWSVLRHLRNRVKIVRFAGSSAGGQCALIMFGDLIENWITFVYPWRMIVKDRLLFPNTPGWCQFIQLFLVGGIKDLARAISIAIYAPLAEKTSSIVGVHMSCSALSWSGFRNYLITRYSSFEEVIRSLLATGAIPLLSSPFQGQRFRDQFLYDGWFTKPMPLFKDRQRPQLIVDIQNLHVEGESIYWVILGPDPELQRRVIEWGQDDIIRLLTGNQVHPDRQKILQLRQV